MSTATTGDFIWYDLLTSDPSAAVAFYSHVVGWTSQAWENGYTMFVGSQGPLAGATALPEEAKKMGAQPHWTSNVQVADVDKTVADVRKLGGRVYVEPGDFPKVGRLAVIGDPQGNAINVFTPNDPRELHDRNKPGEVNWHELMTTEHESAFAFYNKLFGWQKLRDFDMGPMGKYVIYGIGGKELGGMFTKPEANPVPLWFYYIQVPDLVEAVDRAKAKGGKLLNGPMQVPGGAHIAQLSDPQGVVFALHENAKTAKTA